MNSIIVFYSAFFYCMIAAHFLRVWLKYFGKDYPRLSAEDKLISKQILALATIFWPIVVPLAYLELLETKRTQERL
ncbi:MAG TPA: hypothetical protein DDW76_37075 [Cyanobacteria bacterium UBA11369]|nr:hypothetical protein [Cyanobacteria bacterium UBA11371]HBE54219.1 hypothetical protein [Cyanobacteria bacterium UBA11369]